MKLASYPIPQCIMLPKDTASSLLPADLRDLHGIVIVTQQVVHVARDSPQMTNAPYGQDSFSFHSQNMTVAARAMAERKTFGHRP